MDSGGGRKLRPTSKRGRGLAARALCPPEHCSLVGQTLAFPSRIKDGRRVNTMTGGRPFIDSVGDGPRASTTRDKSCYRLGRSASFLSSSFLVQLFLAQALPHWFGRLATKLHRPFTKGAMPPPCFVKMSATCCKVSFQLDTSKLFFFSLKAFVQRLKISNSKD